MRSGWVGGGGAGGGRGRGGGRDRRGLAVGGPGHDGDRTHEVRAAVKGGTAKNVIFLLGDGMGDSEITSARYYAYGAGGSLPGIDALPLTGEATTWSLVEKPGDPLHGKPELRARFGGDRDGLGHRPQDLERAHLHDDRR